jgi:uncharacterized damage-inducible protein DinB
MIRFGLKIMENFFEEYFDRLVDLHLSIQEILDLLPQDALDWQPGPDIPSICVLVTHIAGAERYWIGDVAAGDSSNRDREAEFNTKGVGKGALKVSLDQIEEYARQFLATLPLDDLDSVCISSRDGKPFTVAWALLHALEHTAIHLGHIQIIRQLWDLRKG